LELKATHSAERAPRARSDIAWPARAAEMANRGRLLRQAEDAPIETACRTYPIVPPRHSEEQS